MVSIENRKLIDAIEAPEEHAEFVSRVIDNCRSYCKEKRYFPVSFNPVPKNKYFCAYKQGGSARGEGEAIIGFSNQGEGLNIVFHHVVVDLKGFTIKRTTDKDKHWRRLWINRQFNEEEIQYICKLAYQCFDKVFR